MVGRVRSLRFLVVALALLVASPSRAADVPATTDTGALRAGRVVVRRALPWILAFAEELLELIKGGAAPPPPAPPPPDPLIEDPDYTP